jgi:penicillin-binding protein 1A
MRIGNWAPENYGNEYRGVITLHQAFAVSSNVAAVRLSEAVGRDEVLAAARDLGLDGDLDTGPAMALGTSSVPLIQMVGAYAAVHAGRYPGRPHGLALADDQATGTTPMDRRVRAEMLELLWASANEGSGRGARLATPTFGKTGTSQDSRDAYFIGFSGDLITGVWIGYDDNRPMPGAQGGGVPAAIWRTFMTAALASPGKAPAPPPQRRDPPSQPGIEQAPAINREYDVEPEPLTNEVDFSGAFDGAGADVADQPIVELPADEAPERPIPRITALPAARTLPPPAAEDEPAAASEGAE